MFQGNESGELARESPDEQNKEWVQLAHQVVLYEPCLKTEIDGHKCKRAEDVKENDVVY